MDFFDSRYYSLNRKTLLLIGQWPYENQPARVRTHILVVLIIISGITVQVSKLFTSKNSLRTVIEVISVQLITLICLIKYWNNNSKRTELKMLLEEIKRQWETITDQNDCKILHKFAEMGRKYSFYCALFSVVFYTAISLSLVTLISQPLLIGLLKINMTKTLLCPAEYFVDEDEYFYPIMLHTSIFIYVLTTIILASDTLLILFLYHACGLYEAVGHRVVHTFDKCGDVQEWEPDQARYIQKNIADAVKYHKTATEFRDKIMSIFGDMVMLTVLPLAVNISLTLYITATYLDDLNHIVTSLTIAICHMADALVLIIPCQKIVNYSTAISFRAYCSQWYMVPAQLQTLVLPIIQRCAKPDTLVAGKMLPLTLEFYAAGIQTSLSYFMVLLSFR